MAQAGSESTQKNQTDGNSLGVKQLITVNTLGRLNAHCPQSRPRDWGLFYMRNKENHGGNAVDEAHITLSGAEEYS